MTNNTLLGRLKCEPLTSDNLEEALALGKKIFSNIGDSPKEIEHNYRISLSPRDQWDALGAGDDLKPLSSINYYVARYRGKIVGITGLYEYKDEPHETWIGWFGVNPAYRGKGFGKELLSWTLDEAHKMGKETVRLWTSNHPDVSLANIMYSKAGFQKQVLPPSMQVFGCDTYIFSKGLTGMKPTPWIGYLKQGLGGAENSVPTGHKDQEKPRRQTILRKKKKDPKLCR